MTTGRRTALLALAGTPLVFATGNSLPGIEQRIFEGINFQRVAFGYDALEWDPVLCRTARVHSRRMLEAHFFSHVDPVYGDLAQRLNAAGIAWIRCGENVFKERDYTDPAAIAVVEWMYSEGHRANVLTAEFRSTGVGVAFDSDGTYVATQQFLVPPDK